MTGYPRNGAPGPGEAFKPGLPEINGHGGKATQNTPGGNKLFLVCVFPFIVNQALVTRGGSRQGGGLLKGWGLWAIPATRAWLPTTRDQLRPIVSCVELHLDPFHTGIVNLKNV